jgi:hypothetical protein
MQVKVASQLRIISSGMGECTITPLRGLGQSCPLLWHVEYIRTPLLVRISISIPRYSISSTDYGVCGLAYGSLCTM